MKKLLAILLAVALVFCLCACDGDEEEEKIKIGYTFWDADGHGLTGDAVAMFDLLEEALNIEILYNTSADYTADGVITCVENFISAGCKGVVCCNFAESSMVNIGRICKDAGVYFAQFYRTLSDGDVIAALANNEYYVGRVHEGEYNAASALAEAIVDAGCKNVALISAQHGDNTYETRAAGYRDVCAANGVKIVTEQWDVGTVDGSATTVAENLLTAYPEIDGFLLISCSYAPYVLTAFENLGKETLPMVGIDFDTSLGQYISEGKITAMAGGHHNDPIFAALLVYNAIKGAYDDKDTPIDVVNNLITINGSEEYENYSNYFVGWEVDPYTRQAFTKEELQQLTIVHNRNHTYQDIINAAAALSVADTMQRHADLYN